MFDTEAGEHFLGNDIGINNALKEAVKIYKEKLDEHLKDFEKFENWISESYSIK